MLFHLQDDLDIAQWSLPFLLLTAVFPFMATQIDTSFCK